MALRLGWMMGAGIFVLTGVAASLKAGPGTSPTLTHMLNVVQH